MAEIPSIVRIGSPLITVHVQLIDGPLRAMGGCIAYRCLIGARQVLIQREPVMITRMFFSLTAITSGFVAAGRGSVMR